MTQMDELKDSGSKTKGVEVFQRQKRLLSPVRLRQRSPSLVRRQLNCFYFEMGLKTRA
ncbi:hypothetical protein JHK85_006995 [Glycine max]|uniref:Uncharacterized protein n=1 Tax=Glycine soja TaxID=3848 RepID=A0A0B2RER3_GLYSO|nr:hypothetical protein JHK87_006647 [Glycine soja]KAG5054485.1 hypothetical protein JHK85_006995 [Glycine max]KHN31800.1 hypothetical protein glysoja_050154 [Glycine soja]